jgi:hypothetical protein
MKKEYIIGGLALLGVIGLVSYLRKPKRNSEGFFGATGNGSSSSTDGLPDTFYRKDGFCKVCVKYERKPSPKGGLIYTKRLMPTPYTVSLEEFSITSDEFMIAFKKFQLCTVNPPTQNK